MIFTLRPAQADDDRVIHDLVQEARINPTALDWKRFVVAEDPRGEVIGCGQVKSHGDGSRELASIAVRPEWRGRGVGTAIIQHLLERDPGVLYLICRSRLGPYYEKFGFRAIEEAEMPRYFRRLARLASLIEALRLMGDEMLVMKRER